MKLCAKTFSSIFGVFTIFDRDFAKIVAPPGDGNRHFLVHLKEKSVKLWKRWK